MFTSFFRLIRNAIQAQANERSNAKFDRVDSKFDHLDERMDSLEKSQTEQNSKLSQIHEVGLANLETLEAKLNKIESKGEAFQSVNNFRFDSIQKSFERLEKLISDSFKG